MTPDADQRSQRATDAAPGPTVDAPPAVPLRCLSCSAEVRVPMVCQSCHALSEPPASATHFELLGFPRRFDISVHDVRRAHRALARETHPDRFAGGSPETLALATRLSAALNEAAETLMDPVSRADYLLTLCGGPSAAEVRDVPGDLLADVMSIREAIEEARASGDAEAMRRIRTDLSARRGAAGNDAAVMARTLSDADETARRRLRLCLNTIRFFDKLLDSLAEDPLAARRG